MKTVFQKVNYFWRTGSFCKIYAFLGIFRQHFGIWLVLVDDPFVFWEIKCHFQVYRVEKYTGVKFRVQIIFHSFAMIIYFLAIVSLQANG